MQVRLCRSIPLAAVTSHFGLGTVPSAGVSWASGLTFDTTYRVVMSYEFDTGSSKLWVNPASESSTNVSQTLVSQQSQPVSGFALYQDKLSEIFGIPNPPSDTSARQPRCRNNVRRRPRHSRAHAPRRLSTATAPSMRPTMSSGARLRRRSTRRMTTTCGAHTSGKPPAAAALPSAAAAVGRRPRAGDLVAVDSGGGWLVSPWTPGRIESPSNSSTRDTGQQSTPLMTPECVGNHRFWN